MSLLKSFESVPIFGQGVKWFETEMHDTLFQHSVFGAIVFLIVSNTGVYAFVREIIFDITGMKLDGNTLQLFHAMVFAVIMYFGSMYLFSPLLGEGYGNYTEGMCGKCGEGEDGGTEGMCGKCGEGEDGHTEGHTEGQSGGMGGAHDDGTEGVSGGMGGGAPAFAPVLS